MWSYAAHMNFNHVGHYGNYLVVCLSYLLIRLWVTMVNKLVNHCGHRNLRVTIITDPVGHHGHSFCLITIIAKLAS